MALSKITTASLSDNAVTTAKITDANITTAKIADTAITTAKITDANITTAKIADTAITTAKITDANISTAKLADDAVTNAKLGNDCVGANQILDTAIETSHFSSGAITSATLPTGSIIQVQSTTSNTEIADTSGNYNGSMLEVNITPTATNSKILVIANFFTGYFNPNGAIRLNRAISGGATTSLAEASGGYDGGTGFLAMDDTAGFGTNGNIRDYVMFSWAFHHLDSPSTTSQITYKIQADSIYSMYFNRSRGTNYGHASSTISAMELKQ